MNSIYLVDLFDLKRSVIICDTLFDYMKPSIAAVTYMLHKSQVNLVVIIFGGSIKYPTVHEVKKIFLKVFQ